MNYSIGDTVLCIDATALWGDTCLRAGHHYTVVDISMMPCCGKKIVKVAGRSQRVFAKCPCGKGRFGAWNAAWRFIKLDALDSSPVESSREKNHV